MTEPEERFANALLATARAWRLAVDRRLKGLGLSHASWMTIAVAAKACAPLSQSDLAGRLSVEGATVVAMMDRLVKAGLFVRQTSETDRRVKRVVLTADGNRLCDNARAVVTTFRNEMLAHMDSKKLALATELLEACLGYIEGAP